MNWGNRAKDLVLEYLDVKKQSTRAVTRPARVRWTPPAEQNYRGNFNATFLMLWVVQVLELSFTITLEILSLL